VSAPKRTPALALLADHIATDRVRWYHWRKPWAYDTASGHRVTKQLRRLLDADPRLADAPNGEPNSWVLVALTEAGREWAGGEPS
jgi:hypothetical protein